MDKNWEGIMLGGVNPSLKFSADYAKLPTDWAGRCAKLHSIHRILLQFQMPGFLEFDTRYRSCPIECMNPMHPDYKKWHYELPKRGEYLLLVFEMFDGPVFCTIRRYTPIKLNYYEELIGRMFDLVRTEAEAKG